MDIRIASITATVMMIVGKATQSKWRVNDISLQFNHFELHLYLEEFKNNASLFKMWVFKDIQCRRGSELGVWNPLGERLSRCMGCQ